MKIPPQMTLIVSVVLIALLSHSAFGIKRNVKERASAVAPELISFSQEVMVEKLEDPMMFELLPDGGFLIIERLGKIKHHQEGATRLLAQIEVMSHRSLKDGKLVYASGFSGNYARECGLLGVALSPDFKRTGFVYVVYTPVEPMVNRLSRFTFKAGVWDMSSEKIILEVPHDRKDKACHEAGCLAFDNEGNLYWSIGDNTNPWGSSRSCTPQNEDDPINNAMRTSGNSADLRGGILRIKPHSDGSYSIPNGNLFGDPLSRKETYIKGCRNPFRISIDPKTNVLYWGEVGPDARKDTRRGPKGYDEINRASEAGFYGWPFFVADNKAYQLWDFKNRKPIKAFELEAHNPSRFNTGLKVLLKAKGSLIAYPYDNHPVFGAGGRNAMAGPVVYTLGGPSRLPRYLNGSLIVYDWMRGFLKFVRLSQEGEILSYHHINKTLVHPMDVKLGDDGSLYVLEYGEKWNENKEGRILRLQFDPSAEREKEHTKDPVLGMIYSHQCIACHQLKDKSVGPSFESIAEMYRGQDAREVKAKLREKIKKGGAGVWGPVPMPPQPHVSTKDLDRIIDYILKQK